jgi:hypothetical protein
VMASHAHEGAYPAIPSRTRAKRITGETMIP